MAIAHLLEDFRRSAATPANAGGQDGEEVHLQGFESGYQAGWDDCLKAQAEDRRNISADLAQNLQDIDFTSAEAYQGVTAALTPVLQGIVQAVLPEMARAVLGAHILQILRSLIATQDRPQVELACAPANRTALQGMLETIPGPDITVREDAMLAPGQVYIRLADCEREINLGDVTDEIRQAITGFIESNRKDR